MVRRGCEWHRSRPGGVRSGGRSDRHQRGPDAGHGAQPGWSELDPDRLRGWLPADPDGRSAAADDVDHRPDPFRRRECRQALAAPGSGRARRRGRRLLEVRGQDPHPVQRRARRVPGPRRLLRLLHRWPRHGRWRGPARLWPEYADHHAGQGRCHWRCPGLQPDGPQQRLQAPCRRLRCLRVQPGPDHRRAGRLQRRLWHVVRCQR